MCCLLCFELLLTFECVQLTLLFVVYKQCSILRKSIKLIKVNKEKCVKCIECVNKGPLNTGVLFGLMCFV